MKLIKFNEDKIYNEFRFVKGCVYELENNFAFRWLKRGCSELSKEDMKNEKLKLTKDPRCVEVKKESKKEVKKVIEQIKEEKKTTKPAIKEVKEDKPSRNEKIVDTKDSEK